MKTNTDVKFVYSTYISAEPEKVWEALTSAEFSKKYWFGREVEGDWKEGGKVRFIDPEGRPEIVGTILKCEKPLLLSYTWALSPDHPFLEKVKDRLEENNAPTKVSFILKKMKEGLTKLTVLHEDLLPKDIVEDTDTFFGLNNGWPAIIASLKSLLETGKAIEYDL
ncbi:hypothetical protein EHO59_17920 [Leptospira semungkisensis]|uniref:Activator of Hsp90 ATPase homologue 1/2-like C-terminal domain-containing protein n=1 Tax=Leptospira semungkisensis TaxID=2484985 RepID=A0A4R9FNS1_9LEPT|nr:SRPBCC family protein [Leptospira semungkisensis]TGJ99709.1 hypothetical protein EHO59_17920 [Leptospira semungkisensis]